MVYSRMIRIDERLKDVLEAEADKDDRSVNWLINKVLCDRFLSDQVEIETKTAPKKKAARKKEILSEEQETPLQALCREIWKSYSDAIYNRYRVEPKRNATVNSQIKKIAERLGKEAVYAIRFYVGINDAWLVKNSHTVGAFLKNAEGFAVQAATGQAVTGSNAREVERTQTTIDVVEEARRLLDANN